jgi:hypothetical protein
MNAMLTPKQRDSRGVRADSMEPSTLYRAYDASGDLLYVGIAKSWMHRWAHHQYDSAWFADVRRIELEPFPTRRAALDAERIAIRTEAPLYNIEHNSGDRRWQKKKKPRSVRIEELRSMVQRARDQYGDDSPMQRTEEVLEWIEDAVASGLDIDREPTAAESHEWNLIWQRITAAANKEFQPRREALRAAAMQEVLAHGSPNQD